MELFGKAVLATVILTTVTSFVAASTQEIENVHHLMKLLSIPQKSERYFRQEDLKYPQPDVDSVLGFSWKTCQSSAPVNATVDLKPDPLTIPGTIQVTGNATLTEDIAAPVKLALKIEKKVLVWIPIPCVDNVGSCTYDDVCEMLDEAFPPSQPCPDPLGSSGLPCHCPFKAGKYYLPPSPVEITTTGGIPSWLTSGDYKVSATATDSAGKVLACYNVQVTLT